MTIDTWLLIGTGALLVFWGVGAHNRLSALRDRLVRRHAEVDRVLRLRRRAVIAWVAAAGDGDGADLSLNESVLDACAQAEAAAEGARRAPTRRGAIAAANMAEQVLERTVRTFMAHASSSARPASAPRRAAWVGCEVQLAVARQAFNREVVAYNAAVSQFPASVLAAVTGLRPTLPVEAGPELSPAAQVPPDGREGWADTGAATVPQGANAGETDRRGVPSGFLGRRP